MTIVDRWGAIFDNDGLLMDSEWVYCDATIDIMKAFGIALSTEEYKTLAGKDSEGQFSILINEHGLEKQGVTWQQLAALREPIVEEKFATVTLPLMPYAKEALAYFAEQGIPRGICSNGPGPAFMIKAKRTGILEQVNDDEITTLDDIPGQKGKPEPHIYHASKRQLGITRGVVFEDTVPGALAGVRAGLQCFAVPSPYTKNHKFPDGVVVCENLEEAVHLAMHYR